MDVDPQNPPCAQACRRLNAASNLAPPTDQSASTPTEGPLTQDVLDWKTLKTHTPPQRRRVGGSQLRPILGLSLAPTFVGADGAYDAGSFDRYVTEQLEGLPPEITIRLDVGSTPPCWWFPAPFGPQHRIELIAADRFTLEAWHRFLGGNPAPDSGAAA